MDLGKGRVVVLMFHHFAILFQDTQLIVTYTRYSIQARKEGVMDGDEVVLAGCYPLYVAILNPLSL